MDRPEVWVVIVLAAAVTLLERGSFLVTRSESPLPRLVRRGLKYVPAAVFAAIAVPAITATPAGASAGADLRIVAALLAGVVAWRTRNVTLTFVVGMLALWALTFVLVSSRA